MRISDWSSDVCSSDLEQAEQQTFERLDIGMEFMAKLGFGQQYTREKRTERHRQSNRGHRQRGADHDQQSGRREQFRGIRRGDEFHDSSEERSVGKEWFSTCSSRWSPYN